MLSYMQMQTLRTLNTEKLMICIHNGEGDDEADNGIQEENDEEVKKNGDEISIHVQIL